MPMYETDTNMMKVPLGYIIDVVCGLKGFREGKVGLFENQALVLVAYDGATSTEIESFVKQIKNKILEKIKIEIKIENEVVLIQ